MGATNIHYEHPLVDASGKEITAKEAFKKMNNTYLLDADFIEDKVQKDNPNCDVEICGVERWEC